MLRYSLDEPAMADRIDAASCSCGARSGLRTPGHLASDGMTEVNCAPAMGDAVLAITGKDQGGEDRRCRIVPTRGREWFCPGIREIETMIKSGFRRLAWHGRFGPDGSHARRERLRADRRAGVLHHVAGRGRGRMSANRLRRCSMPVTSTNWRRWMDAIVTCQGGDYTKQVYPLLRNAGWNGLLDRCGIGAAHGRRCGDHPRSRSTCRS